MNEFDIKAAGWDMNRMHHDRAAAIAENLSVMLPLNPNMTAMEFGAGTGLTSFLLRDKLKTITMIDTSVEMVKILGEKISASNAPNLSAICFDLEKSDWTGSNFDLIISQMVLHHVPDIELIFEKFSRMLNPGGFLAIADLYPEDGTFHGLDFEGHKGFDPEALSASLKKRGFINPDYNKCFVINKKVTETETKLFDVFLLTVKLPG